MNSTNPLSKRWLEKQGYFVEILEHWVSFGGKGGVRKDFLGCFDGMALRPPEAPLAWQSTSKSNLSSHKKKITLNANIGLWKGCGGGAVLISWSKVKNKWTPTLFPL